MTRRELRSFLLGMVIVLWPMLSFAFTYDSPRVSAIPFWMLICYMIDFLLVVVFHTQLENWVDNA